MDGKTLYEILEIPQEATPNIIKKAYKKAALKYHPDKQAVPSEETTKIFHQVVEAYTVLMNEGTRKQYDQTLLIKKATAELRNQMSDERKQMIEELEAREKFTPFSDPLQPYRKDLADELQAFQSETRSARTFPEFENVIIQALLR